MIIKVLTVHHFLGFYKHIWPAYTRNIIAIKVNELSEKCFNVAINTTAPLAGSTSIGTCVPEERINLKPHIASPFVDWA